MEQIEIIRLSTKFEKSISRLSNDEKAYILSGLFSLSIWREFEIRDDTVWDLLSLIHFENKKMSEKAISKKWKKDKIKNTKNPTGVSDKTPKDEEEYNNAPMVQPMVQPMVDPMGGTKEKEKEKVKENIKEKKVFLTRMDSSIRDYIENDGYDSFLKQLLIILLELWWIPSKNDTIDSLIRWFKWVDETNKEADWKRCINEFFFYWNERPIEERKWRNWLITFSGSPVLPANKKTYEKK